MRIVRTTLSQPYTLVENLGALLPFGSVCIRDQLHDVMRRRPNDILVFDPPDVERLTTFWALGIGNTQGTTEWCTLTAKMIADNGFVTESTVIPEPLDATHVQNVKSWHPAIKYHSR